METRIAGRALVTLLIVGAYPVPASAVPHAVPYIAEVTQSGGAPFDGTVDVEIGLFLAETGGEPEWAHAFGPVQVTSGTLMVLLGGAGSPPLDGASLAPDGMWLEITLDGATLVPRQRMASVPYALLAGDALRLGGVEAEQFLLAGAGIDVGSVAVGGAPVIDSSGNWLGNPAGLEGPPGPPGTSQWSDGPGTVTTAAKVGIATTQPAVHLDVAGPIRIGDTQAPCDASIAGALRRNAAANVIEYCDGSAWSPLGTVPAGGLGVTPSNPGLSCYDILTKSGGSLADGKYWIDPNGGPSGDSFEVLCDMTTEGGGWILVGKVGKDAAPSGFTAFATDKNTASLTSGFVPGSTEYSHWNLARFNAFGSNWTLRASTDSFNNQTHFQHTRFRPKPGATCTPGQAGANWVGTGTFSLLLHQVSSTTTGLANSTWLPVDTWDLPNSFMIFGYRNGELSNPCLDSNGQTQICHAPAGTLSNTVSAGTITAAYGYADGVAHAHVRNGTYWLREVNTDGVPGAAAPPEQVPASCLAILQSNPGATSGPYWIDPNGGSTADAFQAFCDMTTFGGGWILVGRLGQSFNQWTDFSFDYNTVPLAQGGPPAPGEYAHWGMKRFDAFGSTWTIRIDTDSFNNQSHYQHTFFRPKAGATCTPLQAGTNWIGTSTYALLDHLVRSSTTGLNNTTWLPVATWDIPSTVLLLFGYRQGNLSNQCLTAADQTQICHATAGVINTQISSGTHTAAFGYNDGVPHAHAKRATYWIRNVVILGKP